MEQEKNLYNSPDTDGKQTADNAKAETKKAEGTGTEAKQAQAATSYAVRPEHHRHRKLAFSNQDNMLQTRNYLNIGFMLLAIVGVILWTQLEESRTPAIVVLIIAVALKIAEVCIRLFKK